MIRVHRYADAIVVTEIVNAGKSGKVCRELYADLWRAGGSVELPGSLAHIPMGTTEILYVPFDTVSAAVLKVIPTAGERTIKAVRVAPADFVAVSARGPKVSIGVDFESFHVRDLTDLHNEPTAIPHHKARASSVKRAHAWVRANLEKIPAMSFGELTDALSAAGVRLHLYCAVD